MQPTTRRRKEKNIYICEHLDAVDDRYADIWYLHICDLTREKAQAGSAVKSDNKQGIKYDNFISFLFRGHTG